METIKMNAEEIHNRFSDCQNLKRVIESIEKLFELHNQVITKIKVNGLSLNEEQEKKFESVSLQEIQSLEFEVENKISVVQGSIQSVKMLLANLKTETLNLSEQFRHGATPATHKTFTDIVSLCQLATQAFLALKPYLLRPTVIEMGDIGWNKREAHFLASVRELVEAYERQDYTLVSDILEYELSTSLDQWLEYFNSTR